MLLLPSATSKVSWFTSTTTSLVQSGVAILVMATLGSAIHITIQPNGSEDGSIWPTTSVPLVCSVLTF